MTVINYDTDYEQDFELNYPLLYDKENKVINFINDIGHGSANGLLNEKITVDWAYKYDDSEIILRCGRMAIIHKNYNLKKYNNEENKFIKYIKKIF